MNAKFPTRLPSHRKVLAVIPARDEAPTVGDSVRLMIRPEDILVESPNQPGLKATVLVGMYQGASNDYIVQTDAGELRIVDHQAKGTVRERHTEISLSFREEHIYVLSR